MNILYFAIYVIYLFAAPPFQSPLIDVGVVLYFILLGVRWVIRTGIRDNELMRMQLDAKESVSRRKTKKRLMREGMDEAQAHWEAYKGTEGLNDWLARQNRPTPRYGVF